MKKKILLILFILGSLSTVRSQSGLDQCFGNGGKVLTNFFGSSNDLARSIGLQTTGKIIVSGSSKDVNYDFALTRYTAGGTLDLLFGDQGKIITPISSDDEGGVAMVIQGDDKIVLGGYTDNPNGDRDFALVRYLPDGTPDPTFGNGGIVITDFSTTVTRDEVIQSMAIDNNGKLVVGGFSKAEGVPDTDIALARYDQFGNLDATFGNGGKIISHIDTYSSSATALAIQNNGSIVVGGDLSGHDLFLVRYTSVGIPDPGFGNNGIVINIVPTHSTWEDMAIDANGKIVVSGLADNKFAVGRYNTNGALDAGFGAGGFATNAFGTSFGIANAVSLQTDGKIIAGGYIQQADGGQNFAIARFNTNGTPDLAFGNAGKYITDLNGQDVIEDMLILNDGKILVAGTNLITSGNSDFVVARYDPIVINSSINVSPNPTVTGHQLLTVYLGYGPQSVTLTGSATGGVGTLSYNWGSAGSDQSITVSPQVNTVYTLTVTDASGCRFSVSTVAINVIDIRCGNNNDKIKICHKEKPNKLSTICLAPNIVSSHLAHGDKLGDCLLLPTSNQSETSLLGENITASNKQPVENLQLIVYPNPTRNHFILQVKSNDANQKIVMKVVDQYGRVIDTRNSLTEGSVLKLGEQYGAGIYSVRIIQGKNHREMKLIKL